MKKLLILSLIAFFALGNARVFAQGTGIAPEIGSTHDYYVNSTDAGATLTSGSGDTYTWWISTTPANLLTADGSADYTVAGGATYNTGGVDAYKISLTWNPSSAGKTYYLVVQETDAVHSCSNLKAVAITPTNNFTLQYVALTSGGVATDNNTDCAPSIGLSASGATITYDYGKGDYEFKLTPSGLGAASSWSFAYAFSNTIGSATQTLTYSIDGGATFSALPASPVTVASGTTPVIVRVNLNNGSSEEGLAAQTVQMTISNVQDSGSNAVKSITNNAGTDITSSAVQTQTVNARPTVNGISYN